MRSDYQHAVHVPRLPNNEPVTFRWHWPRKTFDRRMSALEIAAFVLPHMPAIVPLFAHHPVIQANFQALLVRLVTWPQSALDEVVPWIKRLEWNEEDEILELDLGALALPAAPVYFVPLSV